MALIVEIGSGLRVANSYMSTAFITSYLTDLGRETENGWDTATEAQKEVAAIAATQYIDTRWGQRFKGGRAVYFAGNLAQALVAFTANPADGDTLTLGQQTYTYRTALGTALENGEVLIGADTEESMTNLLAAIAGGDTAGTNYSKALDPNRHAAGDFEEGSTSRLLLTAMGSGTSGNDIPLSEVSTVIDIAAGFTNGLDATPQALAFPRVNMVDRQGLPIRNIPLNLKQAGAEYAVRAHAASLYSDPEVDDTARVVTEKYEKVGPIEERTTYEAGAALSQLLKPYPAADRLLQDYVLPAGGAFRG